MEKSESTPVTEANPKNEDGFTMVPNEILEALCWVQLSGYEWRVLMWLFRQTYGYNKDKDWISLTQFQNKTGIERRHVHRAIKNLESKKVIVAYLGDKRRPMYRFQNNFLKWKIPTFRGDFKQLRAILSSKLATTLSPKMAPTIYKQQKDINKQPPASLSFKEKPKEHVHPRFHKNEYRCFVCDICEAPFTFYENFLKHFKESHSNLYVVPPAQQLMSGNNATA